MKGTNWYHPSPSRNGRQVGCFYALAGLPKAAHDIECIAYKSGDYTFTGYWLYSIGKQQRILHMEANGAQWEIMLREAIATPELIAEIRARGGEHAKG